MPHDQIFDYSGADLIYYRKRYHNIAKRETRFVVRRGQICSIVK